MPLIQKSDALHGKNLVLRNVTTNDAEFIVSLRTDPRKSKYLSPTSGNIQEQINWLNDYQGSNNQAYFIICNQEGDRLGCIRIYDPKGFNYAWGSWLMIDGLSPNYALEAGALIFSYGKFLGFKTATLDVRKDNESVWRFHENFLGAQRMGEDELSYLLLFDEQAIDANIKKLSKFLIT
jgi:RimJ/RimL family protein N-acetyltransferase